MRFIVQDKQTPHWDTLIRQKRKRMKLTKVAFGRLFGVTGQAVHYWETGQSQAPYAVTWWLYTEATKK